MTNSTEFGQI